MTDEAVLTSEAVPPDERFIDRAKLAFEESELVFVALLEQRAFFAGGVFGQYPLRRRDGQRGGRNSRHRRQAYSLNSTSQYAGVPFLLNKRSALVTR